MGLMILKWFQLILGTIAFILSLGLIIRDIVLGLQQRALIRQLDGADSYKVSLSPDFVGFVRMGMPIGILMLMSFLIWQEDATLGLILLTCFGLLAVLWVVSRPSGMLLKISGDRIFLINSKSREIRTLFSQTHSNDSGTIEIECQDSKGDKIEIECEKTEENIRVINLVTERLTTGKEKALR